MTTSPEMSLKSVISLDETRLLPWQIGYLTAAAKDKAYEVVLRTFLASGLSKAFLARRLGKKPEQITRWLGSPGNWTLETVACLLAAMGHIPTFDAQPLSELRWENHSHPSVSFKITLSDQPRKPLPTSSPSLTSGRVASLTTAHFITERVENAPKT